MDGSVLAVLATFTYQNNLVTSKNDDVTSGSMFLLQMLTKVDFRSESVKQVSDAVSIKINLCLPLNRSPSCLLGISDEEQPHSDGLMCLTFHQ